MYVTKDIIPNAQKFLFCKHNLGILVRVNKIYI